MPERGSPAIPRIIHEESPGLYSMLTVGLMRTKEYRAARKDPSCMEPTPSGGILVRFSRGAGDSLQHWTVDNNPMVEDTLTLDTISHVTRRPWIEVSVTGTDGLRRTGLVRPDSAAWDDPSPLRREPLVTYTNEHEGASRPSIDEWNTPAAVVGVRGILDLLENPPRPMGL